MLGVLTRKVYRRIRHAGVDRVKDLARRCLGIRLGRLEHYPPRPLTLTPHAASPRGTNLPTISIVTPSYNQGAFLERTIRSVLDQKYPRLEYFVQDGGSQDDSAAILSRCQEQLTGWESRRDRGQADALNLGFRRSTGAIMAYLNSDDLYLPGAFHYVARYFQRHPEVDAVYGQRVLIDIHDQEIGRWVLPGHDDEMIRWVDYVPQETLFWRHRLWERVGARFDDTLQFAMDWDFLLRCVAVKARFRRLPRFLAAFRVHPQQKTSAQYNQIGMTEVRQLRERTHGRPITDHEASMHVFPYLLRHALVDKLYRVGLLRY